MNAPQKSDSRSFLVGPLHRCFCRLGLVGHSGSTVRVGLALGGGLWVVTVLLAQAEGLGHMVWTLSAIGGHVRLLLIVPLLFLAESLFDPRTREWTTMLVRYRIVPENEHAHFDRVLALNRRLRGSWLAELIALIVAIAFSIPGWVNLQLGASAFYDPARAEAGLSLTAAWYWFVALGVFRFLILRGLWRLCLWWLLLLRISRMPLRLIPTHPDRAGGLGYLEVVQGQLLPLVVAISALHAAMLAEEITTGIGSFDVLYPSLLISLAAEVVLLYGPMCLFLSTMWAHRVEALRQYMGLAAIFVDRFHQTWATPPEVVTDDLVNTGQWSSLTDMGSSVNVVREMRWLPVSPRLLVEIVVAGLAPALPLLLLKYPISELATKAFAQILGL